MTPAEIRHLQRRINEFFRKSRLKYPSIPVDGKFGGLTSRRVKEAKFYLGYKGEPNAEANRQFLWRLRHPRSKNDALGVSRADWKRGSARRRARRAALRARKWSWAWGGCRGVTEEIRRIVNGRAPITSRKRTETFGNPGSDHHVSQTRADAIDFGVANAHSLKNEISRRLGGPDQVADYQNFYITRKGVRFRVQMIAATHGTGPHLHVGVRRA